MLKRTNERTGHRAAIYGLARADLGFVSVAGDGFLTHWDRRDYDLGQLLARVEGGKFLCCAVLPGGGYLVGSLDGGVHWLYPDAPERNLHLAHHRRGTFAVLVVGEEVFTAGGDGVLTRWSVATGRSMESLPLSGNSLRCLAHDAVRDDLLVGASDGNLYRLGRAGFSAVTAVPAHPPSVFALAVHPNGTLYSGGRDAHLAIWKNDRPQKVPAHLSTLNAIALHPNESLLATASRDKTVKLWRADDLKLLKVVEPIRDRGHVNSVNTLLWLDEDTLLSAGDDRRILEWELI